MRQLLASWTVNTDFEDIMAETLRNEIDNEILRNIIMGEFKLILDHTEEFATPELNAAIAIVKHNNTDEFGMFKHAICLLKGVLKSDLMDDADMFTLRMLGYAI